MSKNQRTIFKDNIDVIQDKKIVQINNSYSSLQGLNSNLPDSTEPLEIKRDNIEPNILTIGSNLSSRENEVENLESDIIELMATKRIDMYNPIFYNNNFIDIDIDNPTMVDLTGYLEEVDDDTINPIKADIKLFNGGKTYYIDVTGEFIADSEIRALNFDAYQVFSIKKFIRTQSGLEQTSTISFSNPLELKQSIQLVYGGTNANGVENKFKYSHARTTTIQGSTRQTNGSLIRYTAIFTTDDEDTWFTGDNPYEQKGYGIYIPAIDNFEVRNLFVVAFELQ